MRVRERQMSAPCVLARAAVRAAVLLLTLSACAPGEPGTTKAPRPTPTHAPPTAQPADTPLPAETEQVAREGAGRFNQYRFTYRREGDRVMTAFNSPRPPWNDTLVVGAAREVLRAAYDDRSDNFPRPAPWIHEGEKVNGIKLEGERYEYVFLPIREGAAVRSILFWQLPKGTIR